METDLHPNPKRENRKGKDFPPALDLSGVTVGEPNWLVKPMLFTLVDEPFDRKGWLFEIKWDGFRAISRVRDGRVSIVSRNQKSLGPYFPSIVEQLKRLPFSALLDGELVILEKDGKAEFAKMTRWSRADHRSLVYYVFDMLYLDKHDLRSLPLIRRKEILTQSLPDLPRVKIVKHIENEGCALFRLIDQLGVEGMVFKDRKSPYQKGFAAELAESEDQTISRSRDRR